MSVRESCGVCGGLVEAKELRTCVECDVRFCLVCEEDDGLCVDCFEEEQEEEKS